MTTTEGPIQVELESEHLTYEAHLFTFRCEACGERLKLDGILLTKLAREGATGVIRHIVETQVIPFLDEHNRCGSTESFSA